MGVRLPPYPNAGTFNLQGPNIKGFVLYNLTGQILLKRSFPNPLQIQSVNLPEIPRGTYKMKEYSQKGFVKMKIQINP